MDNLEENKALEEKETRLIVYFLNGSADETREQLKHDEIEYIINQFNNKYTFKINLKIINPDNVIAIEPITESLYQERLEKSKEMMEEQIKKQKEMERRVTGQRFIMPSNLKGRM